MVFICKDMSFFGSQQLMTEKKERERICKRSRLVYKKVWREERKRMGYKYITISKI